VPIAAGVLYPVIGWLLTPMIGSAAMGLQSFSVIAHALRLRPLHLNTPESLDSGLWSKVYAVAMLNVKPMNTSTSMTIGKLAQAAGVGIDTVRFYERSGLLGKPLRSLSGYRLYAPSEIDRLRFNRRAKSLGFTFEQIAELPSLSQGGNRAAVKALASNRPTEIDSRIADLIAMRKLLAKLVNECNGHGSVAGCPIIESVVEPAGSCAAQRPATASSATGRRRQARS
jgi:MerR family copper efflux transcriptional regulator